MVAPFGNELHVSGNDHSGARSDRGRSLKKADGAHRWKRGEPSLEDVFILLMSKAEGQPA